MHEVYKICFFLKMPKKTFLGISDDFKLIKDF